MAQEYIEIQNLNIDIIDGDRGKYYPHSNELLDKGYCLFLSAQNVTKNGFNFTENKFITKEKDIVLRNGKLQYGDIVITTRGTVGNVGYYTKNIHYNNIRINSGMLILRCNNDVNSKYIYYVLLSKWFQDQILSFQTGTAQPQLPKSHFQKMQIPFLPFLTQQKIARVLSAIDDKIELNNSINSNLEQQAYLMYQNIFGSCEQSIIISDLIDIRDGTHDSPKPQDFGYKLITSKHLKSYGVNDISSNYISDADYNKINERSQVETNDILISMIGTVGIVSLIIENPVEFAVKNVGIFKTSVSPTLIYYVLNYLKSLKTQNYILSHLAGTTQKYISLGELRNLNICKPNEKSLKSFNTVAKPLYDQIINNINENKTLAQLRDTLLPKLMNGEIDVSNVPSLRGMK